MPNWKKVITSGSDAYLNSLNVTYGVTGSLFGTASYAITASYALRTDLVQGYNITASFNNLATWNFNHGLNNKAVIVQAYDTNWNQVVPETINLVDNNNAVISFSVSESGYVIASLGGAVASVSTSSYALTASYALNAGNSTAGGVQVNDLFSYQFLLMGA